MRSITMFQAAEMQTQFAALSPPPQVSRAVTTIVTLAAAGGRVPTDLIQYVMSWLGRNQRQDRFGK